MTDEIERVQLHLSTLLRTIDANTENNFVVNLYGERSSC